MSTMSQDGCTCWTPWNSIIPPPPCPVHGRTSWIATGQPTYAIWVSQCFYCGLTYLPNSGHDCRPCALERIATAIERISEAINTGTPHDHRTIVPGCFRCDLSRDEMKDAK